VGPRDHGGHRRQNELTSIIQGSGWFMSLLGHAVAVGAPDWWIGAGVIRDLVWDQRFGSGFDPANVRDVDVAFFDPDDLSRARDHDIQAAFEAQDPTVVWDAKNQAAVHLWYPARFGIEVEPFASVAEAVGTWPETATCIAVRLLTDGPLETLAPYGLEDLLDGIWRCNPKRVTSAEARRRLLAKDPARRWPRVRVVGSPD
jgi:hypothetical protein